MNIRGFNVPKGLIYAAIIIPIVIFLISAYSSFNNREVKLRSTFDMEINNRKTLFDKMWKMISQKAQVTKQYDSSFLKIIKAAMEPRQDGAQLMMKWVQESNPTMQAGTVQELYKELSRTIEAERNGFAKREETLASIVQQHYQFLHSFPNNFINLFMGVKDLDYKPITSGRTDDVMKTGQDNDVRVF